MKMIDRMRNRLRSLSATLAPSATACRDRNAARCLVMAASDAYGRPTRRSAERGRAAGRD